jgi:hypothetical protein
VGTGSAPSSAERFAQQLDGANFLVGRQHARFELDRAEAEGVNHRLRLVYERRRVERFALPSSGPAGGRRIEAKAECAAGAAVFVEQVGAVRYPVAHTPAE